MNISWYDEAWDDYISWQSQDRKTLKRINTLIKDIRQNPFWGLGKQEPLKGDLSGFWSRRIDSFNRIVYFESNETIYIVSCKGHY